LPITSCFVGSFDEFAVSNVAPARAARVGDSEDGAFRTAFLRSLKARGWAGWVDAAGRQPNRAPRVRLPAAT
jgi:hypothetical protein